MELSPCSESKTVNSVPFLGHAFPISNELPPTRKRIDALLVD